MSEDLLNELMDQVTPLDEGQLRLLMDMAAAFSGPIDQWRDSESSIASEAFVSNFANRLRLHHATNVQKFNKKAFEFAFAAASVAANRDAEIVADPTSPGADVVVDGTPFSLKTEASAKMSKSKITISKLMEARWIRDLNDASDCAASMRHVFGHLSAYERVLVLRAFDVDGPAVRYELWEIPITVLRAVQGLTVDSFSIPNKNGTSVAKVTEELGGVAYSIRLDGSVEKVTISGLATSRCILHAYWVVPTARPSANE